MTYDAKSLLRESGHLAPTNSRHAPEILKALEEHKCNDCGKPVGREARSSAQCLDCLRAEYARDGLPVEECDRMVSEMRGG